VEEYEKYADGADVLHKEEIDMKQSSVTQRAPVGELGTHNLMRHKPTDKDTREEAYDGQEELTSNEVEKVEKSLTEERKMLANA
jgi:hypothetical protein